MPDLPQLDGVSFRPFGGSSDYPDFVRIINAWSKAEGDERAETVEGITTSYDNLDRCDPARDLLVAESDGRTVGYTRVWWDQIVDGPRTYRHICLVDPSSAGAGSAPRFSPGLRLAYVRSPRSTRTRPRRSSRRGSATRTPRPWLS